MVLSNLSKLPLPLVEPSPEPALNVDLDDFKASTEDLELIFEELLGQFFPFRGFFLFDTEGHLLRSTTKATEFSLLLQKVHPGKLFKTDENPSGEMIPQPVDTLCNLLRESREDYPDQTLQLYDTAFLPGGIRLYLTVEWIDLIDQPTPCILVTIEDLTQVAHHRGTSDAYRHGLSPQETDVWKLYLQGLCFRQVSEELCMTLETVKKHMKNIFSKCDIEYRCQYSG